MKWTVEQLKRFFLESAAATYASGEKAKRDSNRFWIKKFVQVGDGQFKGLEYVDEYFTNGEASGGTTWIFHVPVSWGTDREPLWCMHYGGWCKGDDPGVLAFLKKVLAETYRAGHFEGGRGYTTSRAEWIEGRKLEYLNHWSGSFSDFVGGEVIVDANGPSEGDCWMPLALPHTHGDELFWHRYSGGLLVNLA